MSKKSVLSCKMSVLCFIIVQLNNENLDVGIPLINQSYRDKNAH